MASIFLLLVLFQLKHFVADYPLQTEYMLGKFKRSPGYILPLLEHAFLHGALTTLICWVYCRLAGAPPYWALALGVFDLGVHFLADRLKASPDLLGRYKLLTGAEFPTATAEQRRGNKYFWWALGFDQMLHHLTHYVIIAILVGAG